MALTEVGTVTALYRYPVKSMRGENIVESKVGWHGLSGDRRYAFVRSGDISHFPWLTGRKVPALLRYVPYLHDPNEPVKSPVSVRTPGGSDVPVESAELRNELEEQYGGPLHLLHSKRGTFDSACVSLISDETIRHIESGVGRQLDARRFRPNILISASEAFAEEQWLGKLLIFGTTSDGARIRLNRKDERCMMINLDPEKAEQDPAVLKEVVRSRDMCAGLYATPEQPGILRVGDMIYLS